MKNNLSSRNYKVYILLEEKPLEVEELMTIFGTEDSNKILSIICSSISLFIDEVRTLQAIPENNYLQNLKTTILKVIDNCANTNIGESLKSLKKLSHRYSKIQEADKIEIDQVLGEIERELLKKLGVRYVTNSYDFLSRIIYDIKSLPYLKQTINLYPHYINTKNEQNKHIVLELVDKTLELLETAPNSRDILYYNSIIVELMNRPRFHVSNCEIKQYCLKIEKLIKDLNRKDEHYKKKLGIYKTILGGLLNTEVTKENIDTINNKFGVTQGFAPSIQQELLSLPKQDLIITIDPYGSLDMDDAVSIKKENDHYHLRVYIADVARTIPIHSEIDKEAFRRTETIYLSDQTIPMLPTELSNNMLSLNNSSYKDVIIFDVDVYFDGSIGSFSINRDKVLITKNFSYSKVNKILQEQNEANPFFQPLNDLNNLANILKKENPSKDLHRKVEDIINQDKGIYSEKNDYGSRTAAEIIVEEIMVLVNCLTAKLYASKGYPFIYRVHPTLSSTAEYNSLMRLKEYIESEYLDKDKHVKIINGLMGLYPDAYYSINNIGHFGLGKEAYSHVTSPIRRYPDLIVHRLLYDYILTAPKIDKDKYWECIINEVCSYCNERAHQNFQYQNEYERVKLFLKKYK